MKYNDNEWSKMRLNVKMKWNHGFSGYPERLIDNEMKKVKFNHYYFNGKYKEVKRVQDLWFYSEVQKNGGLILWEQNCTL